MFLGIVHFCCLEIIFIPFQKTFDYMLPEGKWFFFWFSTKFSICFITAIWFEKGRFDYVENILRLAKNELRYRDGMSGAKKAPKQDEQTLEPNDAGFIAGFITKAKSFIGEAMGVLVRK